MLKHINESISETWKIKDNYNVDFVLFTNVHKFANFKYIFLLLTIVAINFISTDNSS